MKRSTRFISLLLTLSLLAISAFAISASAEDGGATPQADYTPTSYSFDYQDGAPKGLNNTANTTMTGYLEKTSDGNLYYVIEPGFDGKTSAHTYLSYRDNNGGAGLVFLGKDIDNASTLVKDCTTSFVTLDLDLATKTSLPDYMSISLNARGMNAGATDLNGSSPKGNLYMGLRDVNGTLEISNNNKVSGGNFINTGIGIKNNFVHLTLVLDLRDVISANAATSAGGGNAAEIKAYLYVNGQFLSTMAHGFNSATDFINEIRIEMGAYGSTQCAATDTVLIDNVNLRQFKSADYSGNLSSVIADSKKTLADFDCSIYDATKKIAVRESGYLFAKIGTKSYYSMQEVIAAAKSGDVIRFMVATAQDGNGILKTKIGSASNIKYANGKTGLQNDKVIYELFGTDGALISSNTGTAGTELQATVNGKAGTVEFYSDYKSTNSLVYVTKDANKVVTAINKPSGKLTFSLNGKTLTISKSSWFAPATENGKQYLDINGPGTVNATNSSIFNIGAGAVGSAVNFNGVTIKATNTFLAGQVGIYKFTDCDISWSTADANFMTLGGPTRNGYRTTIDFINCIVTYNGVAGSNARGFYRGNTISNSTGDVSANDTIVTIKGSKLNMPNYPVMFSHWHDDHKAANQPKPKLVIIDSDVNAKSLVTTGYGSAPTISVQGNSNICITDSVIAHATGSKATTSNGTVYSTVVADIELGTTWNYIPKSSGKLTVNLAASVLPLANGKGYVIANPDVRENLSLGSDFNINFFVPEDSYVSGLVGEEALNKGSKVMLGSKTYVVYSYNGIAPSMAGNGITATITLTDGRNEYIAEYDTSVAEYLSAVLSSADDGSDIARAKTLAAAIVKYINTAYSYFGATDGAEAVAELVSKISGIETEDVDISSLESVNQMNSIADAIRSAQLNILSTPKMRFNIAYGYSGEIEIAGKTYTASNGKCNGHTYIEIDLPAKLITSTITVNALGRSADFNAVAYYNYLAGKGDAAAMSLIEALIDYGAEAAAYKPHIFADSYSYNDTYHWHACTDSACGASDALVAHDYGDDGLCECGHVYNFGNGEGEMLGSLGLTENVITGRDDMKYAKVINNETATYTFTADEIAAVKSGDMVLLSFVVKADAATKLTITADLGTVINYQSKNKTVEYTVPAQWTRIYMPVQNNGMNNVTLTASGKIYIAEADFENLGAVDIMDLQLKSGMWMLDEFETESFAREDAISGSGATMSIEKSGNYIYSIGNGKFTVIDATTNKVLASISGFEALRQMDLTDDGKYAVITGRQNGLYIVSLETPTEPKIVTSYNTIEQATGIFVSGDYAFIGNRQYGVEVVDISNPNSPVHKANIHSGEVQSCVVYNNILYAGVWGECGVFMYDLTKLTDSPDLAMIGKVTCNGKGDGMTVIERDGRIYLFAATGQHTYAASNTDSAQNLLFGQGNGMDIFDVTDPANAKWLSTSKIDGRYYYTGNDYWETEVSYDEESGKWYAYLVNTYNGVYVYDVTSLSAPIRLAHVTIDLAASSSPALTHATRTIITTWDQTKINRGPVSSIVVDEGKIYIGGSDTGIFIYETPYAFAHSETVTGATIPNLKDDFYGFENALTGGSVSALANGSYTYVATSGQALGVAVSGNYVYLAAGNEGIIILDKTTLERVGRIAPTTAANGRLGFAQDVKVYGNKLFAAEDVAGLRVYDISEARATAPVLLSSYTEGGAVTQVTIASDGNFAVLHMTGNKVKIVNTSSFSSDTLPLASFYINASAKSVTSLSASGGNMYHHNLSTLIADRYVGFWNHVSTEYWIDFGPAGDRYATPKVISEGGTYTGSITTGVGMQGGVTHYTKDGVDYALRIDGTNVRFQTEFTSFKYTHQFKVAHTGRPTVAGDTLVVSDRVYGKVSFYKFDGTCLGLLTVEGNPDVAYADGSTVYIPLGYQGLLVINTATAFSA